MNLLYKFNQFRLRRRYNKAPILYIVGLWADYGIMPCKYAGFIKNNKPYIIYWTDYNGTHEEYSIRPYTEATTGWIFGYSFSRDQADALVQALKLNHHYWTKGKNYNTENGKEN